MYIHRVKYEKTVRESTVSGEIRVVDTHEKPTDLKVHVINLYGSL